MSDGLDAIRAALAAIPEGELAALRATADDGTQFAPGLLAFLAHAAVDPSEMGAIFGALAALLATFGAQSCVGGLLRATGETLAADPPPVHWARPRTNSAGRRRRGATAR